MLDRVVPKRRVPPRPLRAPIDGRPWGEAIHATAVAVAGRGLLIVGPSGAGKSRLAAALTVFSTSRRPIRLVGDDRILLTLQAGGLLARPHPRIAGFIERRGLGILACPFVTDIVIGGVVRLERPDGETMWRGPTTLSPLVVQNLLALPHVIIDTARTVEIQRDDVLGWWRDACTTLAAKAAPQGLGGAKD